MFTRVELLHLLFKVLNVYLVFSGFYNTSHPFVKCNPSRLSYYACYICLFSQASLRTQRESMTRHF